MPLLPSSITEPAWVEFAALIGVSARPEFSPDHPWGCHRRRVPDRVVFEHVLAALVHGSGYEPIASPGCSDRTIRRRLRDWAELGVGQALLRATLAGYDRMIGLDLDDLSVDGAITKAPCGGEVAGRNPVDRGKQGTEQVRGHRRRRHPATAGGRGRQRPRLPAARAHAHRDLRDDRAAAPTEVVPLFVEFRWRSDDQAAVSVGP